MNAWQNTVAAVAMGFAATTGAYADDEPTRVKIASWSLHENGCSETSQSYKAAIPNPERLDRNYKGAVAGIEIVETEGNNGHSFGNIALVDDGKAVTITLHARGAGNRINNPFNGGNVCVNAAGASEGVAIYAHYLAPAYPIAN